MKHHYQDNETSFVCAFGTGVPRMTATSRGSSFIWQLTDPLGTNYYIWSATYVYNENDYGDHIHYMQYCTRGIGHFARYNDNSMGKAHPFAISTIRRVLSGALNAGLLFSDVSSQRVSCIPNIFRLVCSATGLFRMAW
jgi:hypothetical protein